MFGTNAAEIYVLIVFERSENWPYFGPGLDIEGELV